MCLYLNVQPGSFLTENMPQLGTRRDYPKKNFLKTSMKSAFNTMAHVLRGSVNFCVCECVAGLPTVLGERISFLRKVFAQFLEGRAATLLQLAESLKKYANSKELMVRLNTKFPPRN
jgi:hypothetical protein